MCTEYRRVDVIIPTYKPDERVVLLVKKLLKQSYPLREIHLIDTDTGIFPKELVQLSDNIKVTHIPKEKFDHGGTRHMGMLKSKARESSFAASSVIVFRQVRNGVRSVPFSLKGI